MLYLETTTLITLERERSQRQLERLVMPLLIDYLNIEFLKTVSLPAHDA